jgi:hypothetical protein
VAEVPRAAAAVEAAAAGLSETPSVGAGLVPAGAEVGEALGELMGLVAVAGDGLGASEGPGVSKELIACAELEAAPATWRATAPSAGQVSMPGWLPRSVPG